MPTSRLLQSHSVGSLEVVRPQFMPPGATLKPCQTNTWWWRSISAMPLIVCTEILCFAQSRLQFQAFTGSAISAITNLQSSGLRTEYCCHRKAHIKAIRWAHSYSASPSIHPDILRLQSELVAGFMGDLTVGGPTDTVAADIDYIRDREQHTGLRINASKSEIMLYAVPCPWYSRCLQLLCQWPPSVRSSINPATSSDWRRRRSGCMETHNKSGPSGSSWCGPSCDSSVLFSNLRTEGWS